MPVTTSIFEVRNPTQVGEEFQQTPVYIGTATKRVVVPVEPASYSLAIPTTPTGLRFREDIIESEFKYWKIYGQAAITSISPERVSLTLDNHNLVYESSMGDLARSNLFIVYNDSLVFCTPIQTVQYKVINGKFYIQNLLTTEPLPALLPTMSCIISAPAIITNAPYISYTNQIVVDPLPDQLEIDNFNTLFSSNYILYYDIIDYRWVQLAVTDAIPDDFIYNQHNKLGLAAVLHRRVSSANMTLFSVPSEGLTAIETVLEQLSMSPNKYGYAIVPLWSNAAVNSFIAQYVRTVESNFMGFQIAYLPGTLNTSQSLMGSVRSAGESTIFNGGYGELFGQVYGQASD